MKPEHSLRPPRWLPDILFLVLYLGLRLCCLTRFPVFIDEAFHIAWARDTWALHPFGGVSDGKMLGSWLIALFWPFVGALWVARFVTVLVGLVGLAALLRMGRDWLGVRVASLAALSYILMPFTAFFERLAMADPLAGSLGLVATWAVARAIRTGRLPVATLAGASLGLAILAKTPMLIFLAMPILALLLFARRPSTWVTVSIIYGACALTLAPVLVLGWGQGSFGAGNVARFGGFGLASLPARIGANVADFIKWMPYYVGYPGLALAGLGVLRAVIERKAGARYLALVALLTPLAFLSSTTYYLIARYYLLGVGQAALMAAWAAVGLYQMLRRISSHLARVGAALGLATLTTSGLVFLAYVWTGSPAMPLPTPDALDYIRSNTSGYGLVDGTEWLADEAAGFAGVTVICSAQITCERLNVYLYGTPDLTFVRTDVLAPAWLAEQTAQSRVVFLAQDSPSHPPVFTPGSEYNLELMRRFTRPEGDSAFELYRITNR